MGSAILFLFNSLLDLAIFVIIASAILSWLIAFDVLNVRNPTVYKIAAGLERLTDPLLAPIRRFIPNLGGIDISPVILILLLQALKILVNNTIGPLLVATTG
ncbi:YggT family protein [soil metagenome]